MSDLVDKAREAYERWSETALEQDPAACTDYINALETENARLQKELETAREALEPFANRAGKLDGLWGGNDTNWSPAYGDTAITIGDLRRAAKVYRTLKDKEVAG